MRGLGGRFRELYGDGVMHLLLMVACFATAMYTVLVLGLDTLWDAEVWWQSILVWFLGAVILHDLVLFPAYALVDRLLHRGLVTAPRKQVRKRTARGVSRLNHVRLPVLASGLLFLLFFPGILEQGAGSYTRATGQTQEPFLGRWLLLTALVFALSALGYAVRCLLARQRSQQAL